MLFLSRMKSQTLILVPNPKSENAPSVVLKYNQLIINSECGGMCNYAISSNDGSVIQKGVFQGDVELHLELSDSTNLFQLDIFNAEHHFSYNFIAPGETLAV